MTSIHPLTGAKAALATITLLLGSSAHALVGTCNWHNSIPGPMSFAADFNTVWIPRDAPVGTPIAQRSFNSVDTGGREARCYNDGASRLDVYIDNVPPLLPAPPARFGSGLNAARIIQTNITGVGAQITLGIPFDGASNNSFRPANGDQHVPYQGYNDWNVTPVPIQVNRLRTTITLVKTGPIAPGPQPLDQEMLRGRMTDIPDALTFRLRGVINQAQCTLKADAVSANPVQLGDHDLSHFSGKGTTTMAVPFFIMLNDCEDDPGNITARAHIRLDGRNGSMPLDPDLGLFSLTSDSTAEGIGIQMLASDGITPMVLNRDVPVIGLSIPNTRLDFHARYFQHEDSVKPGLAKGTLSFTISYR
ncbi:fimbrial protein [Pseudomonas sp. NPDC089396]|uniref:fimbrial protein n=1 Tax=Pseudomonas sp. NPDC089396 TaxID=3364461 RepID=UPI00383953DB